MERKFAVMVLNVETVYRELVEKFPILKDKRPDEASRRRLLFDIAEEFCKGNEGMWETNKLINFAEEKILRDAGFTELYKLILTDGTHILPDEGLRQYFSNSGLEKVRGGQDTNYKRIKEIIDSLYSDKPGLYLSASKEALLQTIKNEMTERAFLSWKSDGMDAMHIIEMNSPDYVSLYMNTYIKDQKNKPDRVLMYTLSKDNLKHILDELGIEMRIEEFIQLYEFDDAKNIYDYATENRMIVEETLYYSEEFEESYETLSNQLQQLGKKIVSKEDFFWYVFAKS